MEGKQFKVLIPWQSKLNNYPKSVPWDMLNNDQAERNHSQTLNRLHERGGMCVSEILCNINKHGLNFSMKQTQNDVDELNLLVSKYNESQGI